MSASADSASQLPCLGQRDGPGEGHPHALDALHGGMGGRFDAHIGRQVDQALERDMRG